MFHPWCAQACSNKCFAQHTDACNFPVDIHPLVSTLSFLPDHTVTMTFQSVALFVLSGTYPKAFKPAGLEHGNDINILSAQTNVKTDC